MKTVVYESDNKESFAIPALGLTITPDEPFPVTDDQAVVLLSNYDNEFIDGENGKIRNPLFGKPKYPQFKVVDDKPVAPAPPKPVASAPPSTVSPIASATSASPSDVKT